MLIIYVINYQPKAKCKEGGSYFYKNKKYRPLEIEKKNFFSFILFQKFLIFYVCIFSENAQFLSEHSFKDIKQVCEENSSEFE